MSLGCNRLALCAAILLGWADASLAQPAEQGPDHAPPVPGTVARLGADAGLRAVAASPKGNVVAIGGIDGSLVLWDTKTWKRLQALPRSPAGVSCLTFSPDGAWLIVGEGTGGIRVWDLATGTDRRRLAVGRVVITQLACSPDGAYLAAADCEPSANLAPA